MSAETIEYTFVKKLRLATRSDFVHNEKIVNGTTYYLQSARSEKFEGPYTLWPDSDLNVFGEYMKAEMVFVETSHPASSIGISGA